MGACTTTRPSTPYTYTPYQAGVEPSQHAERQVPKPQEDASHGSVVSQQTGTSGSCSCGSTITTRSGWDIKGARSAITVSGTSFIDIDFDGIRRATTLSLPLPLP